MPKIGSLVIDIAGTSLSPEDKEIIAHPLVGGLIFFTRNYENRAQLTSLTKEIRAVRLDPILIMSDQEGGRVQRFIPEFTRLKPMGEFGDNYQADPKAALEQAKAQAKIMAEELLSTGIDFSLAPVLDLNKNLNAVIGDRAFSGDANVVIALSQAFVAGMREAGMAAIGKHFPGHGSVLTDSHVEKPTDTRLLPEILQTDLVPFSALIKAGISAIMAAHITFPSVDDRPAGFSRRWLQDILRKQLGFQGTIFTDDLNMAGAAISINYADRVVAAREAGCDFALLCNNREGVVQTLDNVNYAAHQVDKTKWGALLGDFSRTVFSQN
jgi:beta-N-acetylhexosaminidase